VLLWRIPSITRLSHTRHGLCLFSATRHVCTDKCGDRGMYVLAHDKKQLSGSNSAVVCGTAPLSLDPALLLRATADFVIPTALRIIHNRYFCFLLSLCGGGGVCVSHTRQQSDQGDVPIECGLHAAPPLPSLLFVLTKSNSLREPPKYSVSLSVRVSLCVLTEGLQTTTLSFLLFTLC